MRWAGLVEIVPGLVDEVANIVVARSVDGEGEDLSRDGDRSDAAARSDPVGRGGCGAYRQLEAAVPLGAAQPYLPRRSCRIAGSIGYALVNWDP
jgi:hypothetical protein